MKRLKTFIIGFVIICTIASILYLIMIARDIEKYTVSFTKNKNCFILYSSEIQNKECGKTIKLFKMIKKTLQEAGYDAYIAENEYGLKQKLMNKDKKYILLDINETEFITKKGKVLIKIDKDNENFRENLELAKRIKSSNENNFKTIILTYRKNRIIDVTDRSLYIGLAKINSFKEDENMILNIIKVIIQ